MKRIDDERQIQKLAAEIIRKGAEARKDGGAEAAPGQAAVAQESDAKIKAASSRRKPAGEKNGGPRKNSATGRKRK